MREFEHLAVESLRTGELLATILDIDELSDTALTIGNRIESEIRLPNLPDATLPELKEVFPGFEKAEFRKLMAAVELGRRVAEAKNWNNGSRTRLSSTAAAIEYCQNEFSRLATDRTQEEFHVLTLDTKHRVLNSHLVSIGTIDASLVHPREVFRGAIRDAAACVMLVHNHPSGDPTPSKEDFAVTERLKEAGKVIGIELLDHIIVATDGVISVVERRNT